MVASGGTTRVFGFVGGACGASEIVASEGTTRVSGFAGVDGGCGRGGGGGSPEIVASGGTTRVFGLAGGGDCGRGGGASEIVAPSMGSNCGLLAELSPFAGTTTPCGPPAPTPFLDLGSFMQRHALQMVRQTRFRSCVQARSAKYNDLSALAQLFAAGI